MRSGKYSPPFSLFFFSSCAFPDKNAIIEICIRRFKYRPFKTIRCFHSTILFIENGRHNGRGPLSVWGWTDVKTLYYNLNLPSFWLVRRIHIHKTLSIWSDVLKRKRRKCEWIAFIRIQEANTKANKYILICPPSSANECRVIDNRINESPQNTKL